MEKRNMPFGVEGGYKQWFGKIGAVVSFSQDYCDCPWDLDPLGPYNKSTYIVKQGLSDWCRATEYEGVPRFISSSLPDSWGNAVFAAWVSNNKLRHRDITAIDKLSYSKSFYFTDTAQIEKTPTAIF
ncbi:MAG: hypothetical protein IJ161_05175 [Bacteroidales bacterium]|nr:hypothetical protein [Bacteroidales bacterium]